MARRPAPPASPPQLPGAAVAAEPGPSPASALLTAEERLSPLFRSLRDIDAIEDPDARLQAALDRLDHISELALRRERTIKNGIVIADPDCNAAVKVEEVAHRLLSVEPRRVKLRPPDLDAFSQPLKAVK